MKVAIVGAGQVGKTTLFGALTRQPVKTGLSGYGDENQVAVIEVPDRRVDTLVEMFRPRKQTRATVEVVDGGGTAPGTRGFGPRFLQEIRQADALVGVVRAFENAAVPEPEGGLDPLRDYRSLEAELILADLDLVEKRLERMDKQDRSRARNAQNGAEREVLDKIRGSLEEELPLTAMEFRPDEEEAIRHMEFVSRKPLVLVANVGEAQVGQEVPVLAPLHEWAARSRTPVLEICAAVEMEVSQLGPEEEAGFLEALGISESGRYRLLRTAYDLLGLQSFFTVGEDEVRAWTIRRGDNAVTAAGKIHSDLARGFIRAEVIPYAALVEAGGAGPAREQGRYRLETRTYVVQDGDILNIRFSV
ncbi:MAG: redox-regulated ATPase YchF [Armatimonadetes bacterium]|nr:redox-regulated ATPase YchF [Armatimonadota bacterium]